MSTDAMEVLIIILAGILIIGAVWEAGKLMVRHFEEQREQQRADHRHQQWLREEATKDKN